MSSRLELHVVLQEILGSGNVYYQPPTSTLIKYPAIVYSRDNIQSAYADNSVYTTETAYELIVIDKDPDSIIVGRVSQLLSCRFTRNYTIENLNHDAFILYF